MSDPYEETLPDRLVTEIERCNVSEYIHEDRDWDTYDEVCWYLDYGDAEDIEMFINTLKYYGCDKDIIREVQEISDMLE